MSKFLSIDPGKSKCGLLLADINEKKVYEAVVLKSNLLYQYVKNIQNREIKVQLIIGNGTSSKYHINKLMNLFPDLIIADEKNTTFRAKLRYFELFPIKGFKSFLPREIFLLNKNLDAISALIIMEDYFNFKFDFVEFSQSKTWLK